MKITEDSAFHDARSVALSLSLQFLMLQGLVSGASGITARYEFG